VRVGLGPAPCASGGQGLREPLAARHERLLLALNLSDDLLGFPFELEDVQAGVRTVDDVDASAVVRRDVVRLDHLPADVRIPLIRATAKIGVGGHGGDERCGLRGGEDGQGGLSHRPPLRPTERRDQSFVDERRRLSNVLVVAPPTTA
jgi:hypothetical protein